MPFPRAAAALPVLLSAAATAAQPPEINGFIEGELRWFPTSALFEGQASFFASAAGQVELYWEDATAANALEMKLFYRQTSADGGESTHGDVRELYYRHLFDGWQLEVGFNKVFWGVTESLHLVDIVNQTDNVEAVNGEEKLGQPMIAVGIEQSWGNLDVYLMPWFRERVFSSGNERFQFGNPVTGELIPWDQGATRWQSSHEDRHIDLALRWLQYFGNLDLGLSFFRGTNREPIPVISDGFVMPGSDIVLTTALSSYYEILEQYGLELQYLHGDWAFKFEGVARRLDSGDYSAVAGGFEYTFSNLAPWGQDVGAIIEYLWNDRRDVDTRPLIDPDSGLSDLDNPFAVIPGEFLSPFENDLFLGARFALNDVNSTEFVGGFIYDLNSGTTLGTFEGSTRVGDSLRIGLNIYLFSNVAEDSSFFFYRHDDLVEAKATWYF